VIHSLALLLVVLGFGPVVAYVPHAALAGVLLKVGFDVIDWRFLRRVYRAPRSDFLLMGVVLLLTVFVDVVTAVGVGIVFASLAFVKEAAEVQVESIRAIDDPEHAEFFNLEETAVLRECKGQALVLHLSGLMSFGAANEMARKFVHLARSDVLIIDLLDVPRVDTSAGLALEELIQRALNSDQEVIVVGLNYSVARLLSRLGSLDLVKETHRFPTRLEGLQAAARLVAAATS
jgi:SulP family sulfate permease